MVQHVPFECLQTSKSGGGLMIQQLTMSALTQLHESACTESSLAVRAANQAVPAVMLRPNLQAR